MTAQVLEISPFSKTISFSLCSVLLPGSEHTTLTASFFFPWRFFRSYYLLRCLVSIEPGTTWASQPCHPCSCQADKLRIRLTDVSFTNCVRVSLALFPVHVGAAYFEFNYVLYSVQTLGTFL